MRVASFAFGEIGEVVANLIRNGSSGDMPPDRDWHKSRDSSPDIMHWKKPWFYLRETVIGFVDDDAFRLSAALSYYSVFSLAPLLMLALSIAGWLAGGDAVRGELDGQLRGSLGQEGAALVQDLVARAYTPVPDPLMSFLGLIVLIVAAGGVFGQLQHALNVVWNVPVPLSNTVGDLLRDRFLSFSMVLGTGFLLLVSLMLTTALDILSHQISGIVRPPRFVWWLAGEGASLVVVTGLFTALFKVLPDAVVRWGHAWAGGLLTALLFIAGKSLLAWYLGRESLASSYGPAGALAIVLLWFYYSSAILLFGAEFTQVWAKAHGAEIVPPLRHLRPASGPS